MKIRISGHNIRFRLRKGDLAVFLREGWVAEAFWVEPDTASSLSFRLSSGNEAAIRKSPGMLEVVIPEEDVSRWHSDDVVGFQYEIVHREILYRILVEKDFACGNETSDGIDAFPHPGKPDTPCC